MNGVSQRHARLYSSSPSGQPTVVGESLGSLGGLRSPSRLTPWAATHDSTGPKGRNLSLRLHVNRDNKVCL